MKKYYAVFRLLRNEDINTNLECASTYLLVKDYSTELTDEFATKEAAEIAICEHYEKTLSSSDEFVIKEVYYYE